MRGLGYKIAVTCDNCDQRKINASALIDGAYEINRRFIMTMRLLGLGAAGCAKFCGLMDMPPFLKQKSYDIILKHISTAVRAVFDRFISFAVRDEIKKTEGPIKKHLTVSGDGTWKKRGFTSLYGVASLVGYHTGKIIDIVVKSAFCKLCQTWEKKKDTAEYAEWIETHEPQCTSNHSGSAGNMEVDAMLEMFGRSETLHGVKYANYVGDGDSKTFSSITNAAPYEDLVVQKKECIGHVQKRMGTRLRNAKKHNKGLGGRGKLTAKMVDKLTVYYGLAIRRNSNSVEKMKNDIWATFYHYSSTDTNPQHEKCPGGDESWCEWQRALAAPPKKKRKTGNRIPGFVHSYQPLPDDVLKIMKPIYEQLSKDELLERCLGGFTQNNNESYNQLIWKLTPKHLPGGAVPVGIAAHTAACIFNEGQTSILKMFEAMGVPCGSNSHEYVAQQDERRISTAELRAQDATRAGRMASRQHQIDILEAASSADDMLYGPGIDDDF